MRSATRFFTAVFVSSGLLAGCGSGDGTDTTPALDDVGVESGSDAGGGDTATDAGGDTAIDTASDATTEAGDDAATEAGDDATTEAGDDAAIDADAGDPCATATCSADATCDGSTGTAVCTCKAGYTGDGTTCTDVDECAPGGGHDCDANADCTNVPGGFTCACKAGYSGDGKTCSDVDECAATPCDTNATCANTGGGYTCTCKTGYTGDGTTCTDFDECAPGGANDCHADATCTNTDGGFTCACKSGYSGDGKACADVDECAPGGGSDCHADATCTNTGGGFTCACKPGYGGDGKTCAPFASCKALKAAQPSTVSGEYVIDPDGSGPKAPITVHCDMTSDGGVGYTMVKLTSASLGSNQTAYRTACSDVGLEVIVPRTKAHAIAIRTWNGGVAPNLVNVFPKTDGVNGLSNFTGTCQGSPCSFYMSDNEHMCNGEPNGDSVTTSALYRYTDTSTSDACPLGQWNDLPSPQVDVQGWVICSTNDAGPAVQASCKAYKDASSVWNAGVDGITGAYPIDPDGAGSVATTSIFCDQKTDGGGWTLGFLKSSTHVGNYDQAGNGYVDVAGLSTRPASASNATPTPTAVASWLDLNTFAFTELRLGAYANGSLSYLSDPIAKSSLRIQFGQNGYYLWDAPSTTDPSRKYFWCGGVASYTDGGSGQVNQPAGAPSDCKNHGSLGSGWDFSETGTSGNAGLTMCGADFSNWMYGGWASVQRHYPDAGAAQAIWVR